MIDKQCLKEYALVGMVVDENRLWSTLTDIAGLVINRHAPYYHDKEELRDEAIVKSIESLRSSYVNPEANLVTFVYTSMRNAVTNFINRTHRRVRHEAVARERQAHEYTDDHHFKADMEDHLQVYFQRFSRLSLTLTDTITSPSTLVGESSHLPKKFITAAYFRGRYGTRSSREDSAGSSGRREFSYLASS